MKNLGDAIAYHQLVVASEGRTVATQRQYLYFECVFLRYLEARGIAATLDALTSPNVRQALLWYQSHSDRRRSRGGEVAGMVFVDIMRLFSRFLEREGILPDDPLHAVRRVKIAQRLRQPFTQTEVIALWGACRSSQMPARDEALFLLLLDTGMRIGEACTITLDHVRLDQRLIVVGAEAKGRRERLVPIGVDARRDGGRTARALRRYLSERPASDRSGQRLFLGRDGYPLEAPGGSQVIERLGKLAGVADAGPHRLRHAQPLYSPTLTPNGWKPMGDLKVGDRVIGVNGRQTSVVGIYAQGVQEIVRVHFTDGASVECTLDHLWTVRPSLNKCWPRDADHWRVMSTRELIEHPGPWHIPVVQPVDVNSGDRRVPIDAYTLGALLGDGHFGVSRTWFAPGGRKRGGAGLVLATAEDETEVIQRIEQTLPAGHVIAGKPGRYTLVARPEPGVSRVRANVLITAVRRLGLGGVTALEKHIPRAYFKASLDNRRELLRGLMDTDGYVNKTGAATFTTISPDLAAGVVELVRSLGGVATMTCRSPYATANHNAYRIGIRTPFTPFHMTRKRERYEAANTAPHDNRPGRGQRYELVRTIKSIEPVGVTECVCIQVANPNGLYVTQDYVVTHNTFATWYLVTYPGDELGLRRIIGHLSKDVVSSYVHFAQSLIAERAGHASLAEQWLSLDTHAEPAPALYDGPGNVRAFHCTQCARRAAHSH